MKQQKTLSPLKVIETKPYRKSRSETLLRLLVSSSYPHSLVSNVVIEMAKGYGMVDANELNNAARELREQERELNLCDFIRCVEIKRDHSSVNVQAKRLAKIDALKQIIDNAKNHEAAVDINIGFDQEAMDDVSARAIAAMLISAFYRSQAVGVEKQRDVRTLAWTVREKKLAVDPSVKSLGDLKMNLEDTTVTYGAVEDLVVESLVRSEYHILLTQNTLILRDRGIRIGFAAA